MSGLRFLVVVTLAWLLGFLALPLPRDRGTPRGPVMLAPAPSRPQPPLTPPRSPALELAITTLRHTPRLYGAQIGSAGITPAEALAWQLVARSPEAAPLFASLTAAPSRAAQLYGLAGLYLTDRVTYEQEWRRQRTLGGTVSVMIGCRVTEELVATVLSDIAQGYWTAQLLTGRLDAVPPSPPPNTRMKLPGAIVLEEGVALPAKRLWNHAPVAVAPAGTAPAAYARAR